MVANSTFSDAEELRKENEELRRKNAMLRSGWNQSIDHVEILQKTMEHITLDAIGGSSRLGIGVLLMELLFGQRRVFGLPHLQWKNCPPSSWMKPE